MSSHRGMMKVAIAVTFHYAQERLANLSQVAAWFSSLGKDFVVYLVTNTKDPQHLDAIRKTISLGERLTVIVPNYLGHPYLLTWIHREVFKTLLEEDHTISHFLYLEDDIEFRKDNVEYWMEARGELERFGLIPSFVRYEIGDSGVRYSTDIRRVSYLEDLPFVETSSGTFVNFPHPYQGMYLLDRTLMAEFIEEGYGPDFGPWEIRETAAQGLTFVNVPEGCTSRNFVAIDSSREVMEGALIHHLTNNYASNPRSRFGSLPLDTLLNKTNAPWIYTLTKSIPRINLRTRERPNLFQVVDPKGIPSENPRS